MVIQGKSLPFDVNDEIPIGIVAPENGQYTIAINQVDGLFLESDQSIYLEDTYLGITHSLRAAPYTFNVEDSSQDFSDRFILRYTDDALSIEDFELNTLHIIAPKGNYIKVNSETSPINTVTVYDLLGRTLITKTAVNSNEYYINDHNLSSGNYIVTVKLDSGSTKSQKVILK